MSSPQSAKQVRETIGSALGNNCKEPQFAAKCQQLNRLNQAERDDLVNDLCKCILMNALTQLTGPHLQARYLKIVLRYAKNVPQALFAQRLHSRKNDPEAPSLGVLSHILFKELFLPAASNFQPSITQPAILAFFLDEPAFLRRHGRTGRIRWNQPGGITVRPASPLRYPACQMPWLERKDIRPEWIFPPKGNEFPAFQRETENPDLRPVKTARRLTALLTAAQQNPAWQESLNHFRSPTIFAWADDYGLAAPAVIRHSAESFLRRPETPGCEQASQYFSPQI